MTGHAGSIPFRRLASEAAWNAAGWLVLAAYGVAITALIFRGVGPAAYGVWATVAALRGVLVFVDAGITLGATREIARDGGSAERVVALRWIALALASAALAGGLAAAWVPAKLLGVTGDDAALVALVTIAFTVDAAVALATAPLAALLRGRERFDLLALAALAQATVGLLALAPMIERAGLAGAVVALLAGRAAFVAACLAGAGRSGGTLPRLPLPTPAALRAALRFTAPLWLLSFGAQIAIATDVPVVGSFFGVVAASAFAVGAAPPAFASALLHVVLDASYPRLSKLGLAQSRAVIAILVLDGCALAGLGFGTLALHSEEVLLAWVGAAPPLAMAVLTVYALTWALNVPSHVLVVAAIARARHAALAPLVLGEAIANFGLSLLLAAMTGPVGPAVATLAALAVSNVILVPALLLPRLAVDGSAVLTRAAGGYAAGALVAIAVRALTAALALPPLPTALLAAGAVLVSAAALLVLFHRIGPVAVRTGRIVRRGGLQVWLRQRRETRQAATSLTRTPRPKWDAQPPLVTVRIATYNRGPLVAERAIHSALAQTHPNIEVVVVGDHCDELTERAVRSVRDSRVRFENLSRRGPYPTDPEMRWMVAGTAPMNRALELARGSWIAPLDDDDEFTPDHVEVLLAACRERDLDMAYGIAESETESGEWICVGAWPLQHGAIVHASVLHRAGLPLRHDIDSWRVDEPGDWNLWRRLRDAGARIGFVERVVCRHYRERRPLG